MDHIAQTFKTTLIIVFFFAITFDGFSQQNTISGLVFDQDTDLPIPFVNVGIKSKFIGTVTDSNGFFMIENKMITNTDSVEISSLGYRKVKIPLEELLKEEEEPIIIYLSQTVIDLDEFTVSVKSSSGLKVFGNLTLKSKFGFAFNPIKSKARENLGREVGVEVDPGKKVIRLKTLKFVLANNQMDKLVLRINIYKEDYTENGLPGEKIYEKIIELENEFKGEYEVSIDDVITISKRIWASIEFLNFSNDHEFGIVSIPVKFPFGKMYIRESSLGEWKQKKGTPSIQLQTEVISP